MDDQKINDGFIPAHGGYRDLLSFQKAEIIYDGTVHFTRRFLRKYDRTIDQMVQAARSGKQNIAEGSVASATSKETELKLTNVARASLEELLIDYEDYLRTHSLPIWGKDHPFVAGIREKNRNDLKATYATFKEDIENESPAICANTMITLINIASYLLKRQLYQLEEAFLKDGGLRERMLAARLAKRNKS